MALLTRLAAAVCAFFMAGAVQAQQPAPPNGAAIYSRNCALCHGLDMKGRDASLSGDASFVPPLDATGKVWRMSDLQFYWALQSGSHAMALRLSDIEMPPFGARLRADEVAALLDHVKASWSKQQRDSQAEITRREEAAPPDLVAQGRDLYLKKCAVCHGAQMEGQAHTIGEGSNARPVSVPPLKGDPLALAMTDAELRQLILGGEAYHPAPHSDYRMPDAKLLDAEVAALIGYLRRAWAISPLH